MEEKPVRVGGVHLGCEIEEDKLRAELEDTIRVAEEWRRKWESFSNAEANLCRANAEVERLKAALSIHHRSQGIEGYEDAWESMRNERDTYKKGFEDALLQNSAMRTALEKIRDREGPGLDGSPASILYDVAVSALSVGAEKPKAESCCSPHTPGMSCCCGCHAEKRVQEPPKEVCPAVIERGPFDEKWDYPCLLAKGHEGWHKNETANRLVSWEA